MNSKIKEIIETKEWTGQNGLVIYHSLLMENGDKINIGKKKPQQVGWELDYEIFDTSQEYNKAKGIMKEGQSFTPNNSGGQVGGQATDWDKIARRETMKVCFNSACEYTNLNGIQGAIETDGRANHDVYTDNVMDLTKRLYEALNGEIEKL